MYNILGFYITHAIPFVCSLGPRAFLTVDNDGNYEPGNCRWISFSENNRNKQNSNLTLAKARDIRKRYVQDSISQVSLAKLYKVSSDNIWNVLHNRTWKESAG